MMPAESDQLPSIMEECSTTGVCDVANSVVQPDWQLVTAPCGTVAIPRICKNKFDARLMLSQITSHACRMQSGASIQEVGVRQLI